MMRMNRRMKCRMGLLAASLSYMYTIYTHNHSQDSISVEQAILNSWNSIVTPPSIHFRKMVIGINCNVDLVVSGTSLLRRLLQKPSLGGKKPKDALHSAKELEAAFSYFFSRGAAAERFISNNKVFDDALILLENVLKHQTESPAKISKDDLHIAMEYKQGEIWGDSVAPTSNRFIVSHDQLSGSSISIDIFFNTIALQRPDLVVLSGLHMLEFQDTPLWTEKLKLIKRNLGHISPNVPVHLELGSMAETDFVRNLLFRIIPSVDSIGLNEQELAFMSSIGGGPNYTAVSGTTHVYKAVEVLYWLITNFGRDPSDPKRASYRLQRIHFHCLTYHIMVSVGSDWSNLQAGLAAGVRLAGRQACGLSGDDAAGAPGLVELRTAETLLLDQELGRVYELQPHSPLTSWMRSEVLFIFSPTLVCKHPVKTVGLGDAISATGLAFSQFYRYDRE